jgi:tRNA 2-thiocytidine biosynthesis protein TtcA
MLAPGSSVLIGLSGGKDSLALAWLLSRARGSLFPGLRLLAARAAPEPDTLEGRVEACLSSKLAEWGIPSIKLGMPHDATKRGCKACADARRRALMRLALAEGFEAIALGHHLDDILATYLMNLCEHGRAEPMLPARRYGGFGVRLIRPLAYVPEESIRRLAAKEGWTVASCSCPRADSGTRARYRERLEALSGGSLAVKRKMLRGALAPCSSKERLSADLSNDEVSPF